MDADLNANFTKVVLEGLVPRVENSAVCISLVPSNKEHHIDPKFCVELGVMVVMDKPIIIVVHPDVELSRKLELIADEVVRADLGTEEGRQRVARAVAEFDVNVRRNEHLTASPEEDK